MAFAAENPVDGDQQSFARIRIRASIPQAGTYTITHPYGVETVTVTANQVGRRAINITRDIGIGAPGNFSGALNGNIGPFLRGVGGPYTEVNPDTGATETFVGDPNTTEAVTGSPNNTNFVRIQGPAGTIQTNVFTVSGKVLDQRAQTPVTLERATYSRNGVGTRVEVFAKAPNTASLCMRNGLALVGTPPSPCQFNLLPDNNGLFFSQQLSQAAPPPVVVVTASSSAGTTKPTAVSSKLSDVVRVTNARYDWVNKRLLVEARSSDEVAVPDLVVQGYGRMSKAGVLQSLTVNDLASHPPASPSSPPMAAATSSRWWWSATRRSRPATSHRWPRPTAAAPVSACRHPQPAGQRQRSGRQRAADHQRPHPTGTGLGGVVMNGTTAVTYTPAGAAARWWRPSATAPWTPRG
jgi:hypothetical protein